MKEAAVTRTLDLAVIAGDGIGPEVTAEAIAVLRAAVAGEAEVAVTDYPFSAAHYLETGEILGDDDLAALAKHDAIVLGAVGGDPRDPKLAGGIIERGLLLKLRFAFDHYVNLRPTRIFPGVTSPLADAGRRRLRRGPGGHRGSVRRQRRKHPGRHAAGDRERGQRQHRVRRRAGRAVRVRARRRSAARSSRSCTRPTC